MLASAKLLGLVLLAAGFGHYETWEPSAVGLRTVGTCHAPDSLSANLLSYVRRVATGTDTASANTRAAWGIPLLAANKVNPVSQAQKCTQLAAAYDAAVAVPGNANRSIDAVTIDRGYVVLDRTNRAGEWVVAIVFDKNLAVQEKFGF